MSCGWKEKCENNLDALVWRFFRSTARSAFSFDTGHWAGSQLSVLARCRLEAARSYAIDVLDGYICHCAPSQLLSSSLSLTHTNLFAFPFFPNLLFPLSVSLPFPFVPILISHQPSAAVRGYHSSKASAMSPSLGSNWTSGSGGGQVSRSYPSVPRASLQHYLSQQHHHPPSTHTSYAYCPAHTAVSTADFLFLPVALSPLTCLSRSCSRMLLRSLCLASCFKSLSLSPVSISGCTYQRSSYAHSTFSFSLSLSSRPSFLHLFPLIFPPLSHTHSSQALIVCITSSHHSFHPPSSALSLLFTLTLPLCNLICFSFIHLLHRQCNERLIEVETLLDGFPCHYPWN